MTEPQKRGPGRPRKAPLELVPEEDLALGAAVGGDPTPIYTTEPGARQLRHGHAGRVFGALDELTRDGVPESGKAAFSGPLQVTRVEQWDGKRKARLHLVVDVEIEPGHPYWRDELFEAVRKA